jgi:hypothetical protein
MRFWISVTSKDHVLDGLAAGFIQAQGSKAEQLHLLGRDDVIFFYSPGTLFRAGEILQAFTAVARVTDAAAFEVKKGRTLPAWRRTIMALPSEEAPAATLVQELDFITDKEHWATAMERGVFGIGEADARRIAAAMKVAL